MNICSCGYACVHKQCQPCHAAYMRMWRQTHKLTGEARRRANARSYAKVYLRRGKLKRQPCEMCGVAVVQMHHDDYSKPLAVRWLCRACHLGLHGKAARC